MNKKIAIFLILFLQVIFAAGQSPGTLNYPRSFDSLDTLFRVSDRAQSTLSATMDSSQMSLNVASAVSFPASGAVIIENEVIYYSGKSGNTLTGLVRGASGTSAAAHSLGRSVRGAVLAAHHNVQSQAIINLQNKLGVGAATPSLGTILVGSGSGASVWRPLAAEDLPNFDAGKITTGIISRARLGSGSANSTTVLFGDGTWKVPSNSGGGSVVSDNDQLQAGESLAQAVERIGSAQTILELKEQNEIAAETLVPKNIALKLVNGASLTSSNGSVLKIENGLGLEAPADQQIFGGNLDVQFTGTYPEVVHPAWFGAKCNDRGTGGASFSDTPFDDYNAIQNAIKSFRADSNFPTFSRYAHGGRVKITGACYSSQTIKVYTNIELYGDGGLDYTNDRIRFPNNTTGILLALDDRTDAEQPQPYARSGANATVRGLFLLSGYSFAADVSSVAISGRTLTAGSNVFNYRNGWAIAEGVVIDGMVWAIEANAIGGVSGDSILPTNTLTVRPFAFTATKPSAPNNTRTKLLTDRFPFPASWIGATVEIEGVTNTITAITPVDGVHSIITLASEYPHDNDQPLNGTLSWEGRVMALPAQTQNIMLLDNHGIDLRGVATVENVAIRGFAGDGIYAGLSDPTTNSATQPNASNSIIRNVKADYNKSSGFNVNYANGNVILNEKFNANYNDLYGISEESQLGNKYTSAHISFSGQNNIIGGLAQSNGSNFDSCYMEDGGVPINLQNSTTWFLGTPSRFSYYSRGVIVTNDTSRNLIVTGLGFESKKSGNDNLFKVTKRFGYSGLDNVTESDGVSNDAEAINAATGLSFHTRYVNYGNVNSPQIMRQFVYGSPTQGVVTSNILQEWTTSTMSGGGGKTGFPNGFYVGTWGSGATVTGGANVIKTSADIYITDSAKGIIQKDRATGDCARIVITNGVLSTETTACPN